MSILIRNVLIFTGKDNSELINGSILIEGEDIVAVGELDRDLLHTIEDIIDGRGMVAMPGLINTHNHSPMALLRGFCDDLRLMEWLEQKMFPAEARMTGENIYWGALLGIVEMIKSGTTTFADMYYHMDYVANAVKDSGIRASLCRGIVYSDDDNGLRLRESIDLINNWNGKANGRIITALGPHAPFTCPPDYLSEVLNVARDMNVPIHIHLAETIEEVRIINERYGKSPTKYLSDIGMLGGDYQVILAHAVHVSDEDIKLLLSIKGGVAHNPMSNLKLGCGFAPIKKYIENGINVSLGTDGAGSASSLDLFKEMKIAAGIQKAIYGDPTVINSSDILKMATINGAKVLNIDNITGTLEAGKKADIILVDINKPHLAPHHDIISLLAYSANGADVKTSIINGKVIMRDRVILTVNEEEVISEAQKRSRGIVEGI